MPTSYAWVLLATGSLTGSPPAAMTRSIHHTSYQPWYGIGVEIRNEARSGELLIVTVIKGSPAHKAGIRVGDVIGEMVRDVDSWGVRLPRTETISTKNLGVKKAVDLILGKEATRLRLMIRREGVNAPFGVDLTRGRVEFESILGYKRKDGANWDYMIDPKSKIGYVRLSNFSHNTYRDLVAAVDELKKQGVKGLVFDLRSNPGGLLDSAIEVTDLFTDDGLIATIRPRGGPRRWAIFCGTSAGSRLDFPMACLVNGETASVSEIVAAALQDHKRGRLFGERTVGKGSVQNIEDIEVIDPKTNQKLRGEIKYTTATFGRPNGKNLDRDTADERDEWGVTPDEVIAITPRERRALAEQRDRDRSVTRKDTGRGEDRQLDAGLKYLRARIAAAK